MIELQKDRTLELGQQVEVYRNLNKGRVFSIRDKRSGLVVALGDKFKIESVTCKVREGGRQRVIREKRKNVHSFLIATYTGECEMDVGDMQELYYNPYTLDSFVNKETEETVTNVDLVYFENGNAYMLKED